MKKKLLLVIVILAFIAGGMISYIAVKPRLFSPAKAKEVAILAQKSAHKTGLTTSIQPMRPTIVLQTQEVNEIIDLLRGEFLGAPELIGQEINLANLPKILESLGSKIKLSAIPLLSSPLSFHLELLPNNIGYCRISGFPEKEILKFSDTFSQWQKQNSIGLILDLRDFRAFDDYAGAADFAGLFIPANTLLFSIQGIKSPQKTFQTNRTPMTILKKIPLVVLIDENTRGAGEMLTYALQIHAHAILVGQPTAGETALYTSSKLKSGRYFYRATTEVTAASGEKFLNQPLQPEILIAADPNEQLIALQQGYQKNAAELIDELPARKRLNEASLIQETDTDVDEAIQQQLHPEEKKSTPHDVTLHRATDVIRGIYTLFSPY
ncbi:MAG: S41 family peptidase [Verrucomicrobiota bacterium]